MRRRRLGAPRIIRRIRAEKPDSGQAGGSCSYPLGCPRAAGPCGYCPHHCTCQERAS